VAILGLGALQQLLISVDGTVWPYNDREAAQSALLSLTRCAS
jgi:hypothetical protein